MSSSRSSRVAVEHTTFSTITLVCITCNIGTTKGPITFLNRSTETTTKNLAVGTRSTVELEDVQDLISSVDRRPHGQNIILTNTGTSSNGYILTSRELVVKAIDSNYVTTISTTKIFLETSIKFGKGSRCCTKSTIIKVTSTKLSAQQIFTSERGIQVQFHIIVEGNCFTESVIIFLTVTTIGQTTQNPLSFTTKFGCGGELSCFQGTNLCFQFVYTTTNYCKFSSEFFLKTIEFISHFSYTVKASIQKCCCLIAGHCLTTTEGAIRITCYTTITFYKGRECSICPIRRLNIRELSNACCLLRRVLIDCCNIKICCIRNSRSNHTKSNGCKHQLFDFHKNFYVL